LTDSENTKIAFPSSASELITLVGAASFAASCAYNFGYFGSLGYSLLRILSLEDIVISAVGWVPIVFACFFPAFLFARSISKTATVEDRSSLLFRIGFGSRSTIFSVAYMLLAGFFLSFFIRNAEAAGFMFIVSGLWVWLVEALSANNHDLFVSRALRISVLIAPLFLLMLAEVGAGAATLESDVMLATASIDVGGRVRTGTILRYLDRGIIFVQRPEGRVDFLPWSKIEAIDDVAFPVRTEPRICDSFIIAALCKPSSPVIAKGGLKTDVRLKKAGIKPDHK
jgi:hypothetical protein